MKYRIITIVIDHESRNVHEGEKERIDWVLKNKQ